MESKKIIRKSVLEERQSMPHQEWENRSRKICEAVMSHPFFVDADTIYAYVDYRNEVGTRSLIEHAWDAGKQVAVPKVFGEKLVFYPIRKWDELTEGYKGILEPGECAIPVEAEHALVIVPGVVFDKERRRLGYGKGFYDRFLSCHQTYQTMAVAFEMQVVEMLPTEAHDIRPEVLITEEHIYV